MLRSEDRGTIAGRATIAGLKRDPLGWRRGLTLHAMASFETPRVSALSTQSKSGTRGRCRAGSDGAARRATRDRVCETAHVDWVRCHRNFVQAVAEAAMVFASPLLNQQA